MYQKKNVRGVLPLTGLLASLLLGVGAWAGELRMEVTLSGDHEVPPVQTEGSGSGVIVVDEDRGISGSVTTENVAGTMAHIHEAPADANGPVVIPLEQTDDNTWSVPEGTQLTEAQYETLKEGHLYINVHTDAHPAGEVRGQLKP